MEKTWRWFGKKDKITLSMLRQIGVEGIVTALHEVPNGEIWTVEAINDLKQYIESYGMRWSVVESLPVCEAIKYAGPERDRLIENYKVSLANLGKCGVKTVCYNFMPVIDWVRTDLHHPWADGSSPLYYDRVRFAYFDTRILQRAGAEKDYTEEELRKVAELDKVITEAEKDELVDAIIVKTQGFVNGNIREGDKNPVAIFKRLLSLYDGIDRDTLRENMRYFLSAVMPVCEEYGVNMCVHPDDPPFQILGRAGNTATTQLVVERFTAEQGQVVENLTLDITTLAFDGDEMAAHLGSDDLKGSPLLFDHIETNGTYTYTYPFTTDELADLRAQVEEQNPGVEFTDEEFYEVLINAYASYCSTDRMSLWYVSEGSWVVLSMTIDEAQQNYKVGSAAIEVNENTYSPVEEIDKYLGTNASKALLKKAGHLDVKKAAAMMKKYMDKKSTYSFKTSIKDMSKIRSMKK